MTRGIYVVCNPAAGRGRGGRLLEPLLAALREGGGVEHGVSGGPGHEERLTREAIGRGYRRVVAVGGDGTWSNVANALLEADPGVELGLVPGGTGSDLAKSLEIPPDDPPAWARIVREGRVRVIDVGRVEDRHFINIAGFGYDVAVIEHSWSVRLVRGKLLYLYSALHKLLSYGGFGVEVGIDGTAPERRELLMMIVANARFFGGAFRIAPQARLDDGRLDVIAFGNMGPLRRLVVMGRLIRGVHERAPGVSSLRTGRLALRFPAPPAYETDGEWRRARSCELELRAVPSALRVLVPRE